MKLVKTLAISMAILLVASSLAAQQKISFLGQVGYGLGLGGEYIGAINTYNSGDTLTSTKDKYLSLGKGLSLGLGAEISLNPNFNVRISGGYSTMPSIEVVENHPSYGNKNTYKGHIIGFNTILIAKAPLGALHPYVGMGPGLYFGEMKQEETSNSGLTETQATYEVRFKPAIGFCGLVGLEFHINGSLIPFVELNFQQAGLTRKELEVTEYKVDGVDQLSSFDLDYSTPGIQHTITYKKNSTTNPPPQVISGSNFGLRVGVKFTI
jgi:opacity protein-like surface antigen